MIDSAACTVDKEHDGDYKNISINEFNRTHIHFKTTGINGGTLTIKKNENIECIDFDDFCFYRSLNLNILNTMVKSITIGRYCFYHAKTVRISGIE